jgi:hypothetical protein
MARLVEGLCSVKRFLLLWLGAEKRKTAKVEPFPLTNKRRGGRAARGGRSMIIKNEK